MELIQTCAEDRPLAVQIYGSEPSEMADAARDWKGADLEAAREACPNKLDFANLLPRVDKTLA